MPSRARPPTGTPWPRMAASESAAHKRVACAHGQMNVADCRGPRKTILGGNNLVARTVDGIERGSGGATEPLQPVYERGTHCPARSRAHQHERGAPAEVMGERGPGQKPTRTVKGDNTPGEKSCGLTRKPARREDRGARRAKRGALRAEDARRPDMAGGARAHKLRGAHTSSCSVFVVERHNYNATENQ